MELQTHHVGWHLNRDISFFLPSLVSPPPTFSSRQVKNSYWLSPSEHRDFFLVTASRTAYYMAISVQTFMLFYFRDVIGAKVRIGWMGSVRPARSRCAGGRVSTIVSCEDEFWVL